MPIPISRDYGTGAAGFSAASASDSLGRDAFLKLLVTQAQMQDPLEPMSPEEYIAQLAQFSTVEQLEQIGDQLAQLGRAQEIVQAFALIGHRVAAPAFEVEGEVEGVSFAGGHPLLIVDGDEIPPAGVTQVW